MTTRATVHHRTRPRLAPAFGALTVAALALTSATVVVADEAAADEPSPSESELGEPIDPLGAPRKTSTGSWLLGSAPRVQKRTLAAGEEYVVQVGSPDALASVHADLDDRGVTVTDTWRGAVAGLTAILTDDEVDEVSSRPDVVAVEQNHTIHVADTQADPVWNLDRIDQRSLPLDSAYSYGRAGHGVDIYVVDSGVHETHTEFGDRVLEGWHGDFNDGWEHRDCHGHGTHVAGTAAGDTYGVAKSAYVIPVRVLDCFGSTNTDTLIRGLNWVIEHHLAGRPAVVNMSLGGEPSEMLDEAVTLVVADGITVVVAAGNEAKPTCDVSPARVPEAITVAASDRHDAVAWFSNYGPCNDIFAPGVDIRSASPASNTATADFQGTSMAAPHVAGAAAVFLEGRPGATPSTVASALDAFATRGALTGLFGGEPDRLLRLGWVPNAPGRPTVAVRDRALKVSWPAADGLGSLVTSYQARAMPGGATCTTQTRSCTISGLANGTSYTVTVRASNQFGWSVRSASTSAVPATVPSAPAAPTLVAGDRQVQVSWTAPSSNGSPITRYRVTSSPGDQTCTTTTRTCAVTGLTNGVRYAFRVTASNAIGTSPRSAASHATPVESIPAPSIPAPSIPGASKFTALDPIRVMDTRDGTGVRSGVRHANSATTLAIAGHHGIPADASAVVLNVTTTSTVAPGWVQVFPTGRGTPGDSSNLNVSGPGEVVPNLVLAPVGDDGRVTFYTSSGGHLIADVFGFFTASNHTADGRFVALSAPTRTLDTRGRGAKLGANQTLRLPVTERASPAAVVPAEASAVVVNLTATQADAAGHLQAFPTGRTRLAGKSSNLNYVPGEGVANLAIVPIGSDGSITLYSHANVHVIADVVGYFTNGDAPMSGQGLLVPFAPTRLVDSRERGGASPPGGQHDLDLVAAAELDVDRVAGLFLNATLVNASRPGWMQLFPTGQGTPGASSNVNVNEIGAVRANAAITGVNNGRVTLVHHAGGHYVLDANGWFTR